MLVDLTALFNLPNGPDTSNIGDFVDYDSDTGVLSVDDDGAGTDETFEEAVTLDTGGGPAGTLPPIAGEIVIVVDDAAGNTYTVII